MAKPTQANKIGKDWATIKKLLVVLQHLFFFP